VAPALLRDLGVVGGKHCPIEPGEGAHHPGRAGHQRQPAYLLQVLARHAWLASEAEFGCRFDISVWLQPTSPFRTPQDVERTVRAMVEGGHRAATTVSRVPGHFTPHKILTRDEKGILSHYLPEGRQVVARQEIPPYWYRNGLCYAVTRETLVDRGHIVEEDCVGVETPGHVVNIDDPFELEIARLLASRPGAP
jgi:CMP-N-acetylneuraminic acid synthetase